MHKEILKHVLSHTAQVALRTLSIGLITSFNHLSAQETLYSCQRYNIRDQVPISSLEFSRDGKRLVVSAQTVTAPELRVIDLLQKQDDIEGTTMTALGKHFMGECARFSPDGRFVASGADASTIDIWDLADMAKPKVVHSFATDFLMVTALAFSPNGELLIAGGMKDPKANQGKDELILFDFKKRQRLASIPLSDRSTHLIFSPEGRQIYCADALESILVVDVEKRQVVKKWRGLDEKSKNIAVRGLSLSHDGKRLASGGGDAKVKIWDAETGKLLKSFDGHERDVLSVALSPDAKYVASGGLDGLLQVREVETGRPFEHLIYGTNRPCAVTFSPDGQWLTSGGENGRIFLDRVANFQFLNPKLKADLKPVPAEK